MEVFIKDEDKKWDISYDLANQNNSLDCKDHRALIVKSLDQHDAEVRAEERKKWQDKFDELKEYIKENSITYNGFDDPNFSRNKMYVRGANVLEKITELKGE